MKPRSIFAFIGFIALIAGTYCPILRPFHLFNMDVFDANKPYAIVMLVVGVIGLVSTIINQRAVAKGMAWLSLVLVVLLLLAAYLKVSTSFSFIPFKSISAYLSKGIKFKWGWVILFGGAILAVLGSLGREKHNVSAYDRQNGKTA